MNEFLLVKKAEGRAWRTLDDFKDRITRFFRRFPEAWLNEALHRDCILHHLDRGIGPTAHNLDLNGLKLFINFCIEHGIWDNQEDY